MIRALLVVLTLAVAGCAQLGGLMAPAPIPVSSSLPPVAQEAQKLIREAHIAIAAASSVIKQNTDAKVWTSTEAQGYLDRVATARKRVLEAQKVLDQGLFEVALNQAKVLDVIILQLQRELAEAARKGKP